MIGQVDGVADLAKFLALAPEAPWNIVKIQVKRWRKVSGKSNQNPLQTFREIRVAFRSLPYDNGNDSVNRRLLRDVKNRTWDVDMIYHHGWMIRARLHQNGEREHL